MSPRLFHAGRVALHAGDCREVLAELEANSFDACVTDPPYHFASIVKRFGADNAAPAKSNGATGVYARAARGFMGKQWDGGQLAHEPETWAAVLRVLKPGAHLVAFHAPKNWHRLAVAIEDAGFELRDSLLWLFGSGFPKSHDVSKAIDRTAGAARDIVGRNPNWRDPILNTEHHARWNNASFSGDLTDPSTDAAREWAGFGTSLKPAYEPIILARKPLSESTIAANVLKWGTGAINIDGCRVGTGENLNGGAYTENKKKVGGIYGKLDYECGNYRQPLGRWPANVTHDGSDEVVSGFPESDSGEPRNPTGTRQRQSGFAMTDGNGGFGDSGSAARFFASFPFTKEDRQWQHGHECRSAPATGAEQCISLQSEVAVSALSDAVAMLADRLTLQRQSYRAPSINVTASELSEICNLVTETTLILERRFLLGLPLTKHTLTSSHASIAAAREPSGTIAITINPSKSNGSVGLVTFAIIETSAAVGESGSDRKRLHYTAKADAEDRAGSRHPTIKPVSLIQWLCRLITPPKGTILDCFAGTGTTAEAALREGFRCTLIEREAEYLADIERRMSLVFEGDTGRSVAMAKLKPEGEPLPLFPEAAE